MTENEQDHHYNIFKRAHSEKEKERKTAFVLSV